MRLELDARARRMLRLLPRTNIYSALELLLLAILAVQGARLVWTLVTPIGPLGHWQVAEPAPEGSAAELLHGFDPFFRLGGQPQAGPAVVTSLQLVLFGTRLNDATGRGSAIIATPDGVQSSYAVGEEIMPGVTLKAVAFDHVTIERGGSAEDLFMDQSGAATPVAAVAPSDTGVSIEPNPAAAKSGVTLAQLRAEIGFIPRIDGGKVTGLVVRPQGSGAVFKRIGFKEGDVVTQISGRPISGPADLDRLAADYAKGGNVSLSVERGAEILPIVVTLTGQ